MAIWPPPRDRIERPAYRSLARHLAAAIDDGRTFTWRPSPDTP